jgi:hypothetical protein
MIFCTSETKHIHFYYKFNSHTWSKLKNKNEYFISFVACIYGHEGTMPM